MKRFKFAVVALLALSTVAVSTSSCSKYEEGSKFTLLTKKARLVGEWTLDNYTVNGTSQDMSGTTLKMDIKKDGTYTSTWSSGGFSSSESGKWEFNSDKSSIVTTDSDGDVTTTEILRLANKELKFRDVDGSVTTIMTYVQ